MIDASIWRDQQDQKKQVALAWRTAALTRAKKLPSLKQMLGAGPAKPLVGAELHRRRKEFSDMTAGLDLSKLGAAKRKASNER